MSKKKYSYKSYNYSFLNKKQANTCWWEVTFPVVAKTIGFDLIETRAMDEPLGKLFFVEPIMADDTSSSASTDKQYSKKLADELYFSTLSKKDRHGFFRENVLNNFVSVNLEHKNNHFKV